MIVITILVGMFIFDTNSYEKTSYEKTFYVDATYYPEQKIVKITFEDKSNGTNSIVLEILGMETSFQKTFTGSQFTQTVDLQPSSFGWKIHPITLLVDHQTLGKVAIKTEIHNQDQPSPKVIYGKP